MPTSLMTSAPMEAEQPDQSLSPHACKRHCFAVFCRLRTWPPRNFVAGSWPMAKNRPLTCTSCTSPVLTFFTLQQTDSRTRGDKLSHSPWWIYTGSDHESVLVLVHSVTL